MAEICKCGKVIPGSRSKCYECDMKDFSDRTERQIVKNQEMIDAVEDQRVSDVRDREIVYF